MQDFKRIFLIFDQLIKKDTIIAFKLFGSLL